MVSKEPAERQKSAPAAKFRVHFFGGSTVLVQAENSLKAEQEAVRCHAGIVRKVQFLGKVRA